VTTSIELRRVDVGDLQLVTELFETALEPDSPLLAHRLRHRWQMETTGGIGVGAFAGERLLGYIAARPRAIRVHGRPVRVAELTDGLVDPVVRRRGVFRALHDELVADLGRRDVEALACLPAAGLARLFLSGLRYEKGLTVLSAAVHVRGDRKPRPTPGVQIVREAATGPDYDGLDAELAADRTATIRSADHIRRRYLDHPDPYELVALRRGRRLEGWLVLRAVPREGRKALGVVVDSLHWPETTVQRSVSAAALRWFAGQGCGQAITWRAEGPQDPPLFDARMESTPRRIEYLIRPIRPSARGLLRPAVRSRWVLRPGDTDEY
jgi:hypothetical protein